mmetsp:Transcript_15809/g.22495  ORF Transcript_15809/g.22495 Transcript_15809/m.22495 type:complete len:715 (+) Transcript_15809:46-2190(+)
MLCETGTEDINTHNWASTNDGLRRSKRRRRRSIGLHAGGMINREDIEALEKESVVRKSRRLSSVFPDTSDNVKEKELLLSSQDLSPITSHSNRFIEPLDKSSESSCITNDLDNQSKSVPQVSQTSLVSLEMNTLVTHDDHYIPSSATKKESFTSEQTGDIKGHTNIVDECLKSSFPSLLQDKSSTTNNLVPAIGRSEELNENIFSSNIPCEKKFETEEKLGGCASRDYGELNFDALPLPTPDEINCYIVQLFKNSESETMPCISARLFACLYIIIEKLPSKVSRKHYVDKISFILPLLKSLVQAEVSSLKGLELKRDGSQVRKQFFCSFDFSSTMTAVDSVYGSNLHVERCIKALQEVLEEMDALRQDVLVNQNISACNLLIFLLFEFERKGNTLAQVCSEAMNSSFPSTVFTKAANKYRSEMKSFLSTVGDNPKRSVSSESFIGQHLADFIGRAIRFNLRKFLNCPPPHLTTPSKDTSSKYLSCNRSSVHCLVEMVEANEKSSRWSTAIADGSIASVFSSAIKDIHIFFNFNRGKDNCDYKRFNDRFCTFSASMSSLKTSDSSVSISCEDLKHILIDIDEALITLAGVRASRFVRDLFNSPGVSSAIEESGGWLSIESHASTFREYQLERMYGDEVHLTLLSNFRTFINGLNSDADEMNKLEHLCQNSLRNLWKKFRCGSKIKLFSRNPTIKMIKSHLLDAQDVTYPMFIPIS